MPTPIPQIKYDPDGPPLRICIEFPTLQVVAYTLSLYEAQSNSRVRRETGNNANPEDDCYQLPTPPSVNANRILLFDATFVDPGAKPNAQCSAEAVVMQGDEELGRMPIHKVMTGTSCSGSSFAKLVV
jgi:hypothetical protein